MTADNLPAYQTINAEIYQAYNAFRPEGAKPLFCYVPFSNMSFSFEGRVLACAYNQKVELGHYPQQSVRQMWFESAEGNTLREHMQHNDLSYGCKHCRYFFNSRKFSGLKPLVFDKYSEIKTVNYPKVLEFELSNTCNLECVMCNGKVSSSIRNNRDQLPPIPMVYDDAFVKQLEEFIPHIEEAKFYGGEPFLIPIYHQIWDLILKLNPNTRIFVITNGTTLNSRIKDLLERGNFDIAVSMDSPQKEFLEAIRLNTRHDVVMQNIAYLNNYCKQRGKNLVISFTLMRINWREFVKIIQFCNEIDASLYVSYLKTPSHLAIWNLPSDELADILEELRGEEFPDGNYAQKTNKQCYTDLLTYLENCELTNRARSADEIIPLQKNVPLSEVAAEMSEVQPVEVENIEAGYKPAEDYLTRFTANLQAYFNALPANSDAPEAIVNRLEAVLQKNFSGSDKNKVYFFLSITPTETAVKDIKRFTDEELISAIASVI